MLRRCEQEATIPFRITSFADLHHLTPIESYSYRNRERGWGHCLPARFLNAFLHSATVNSNRIRSYEKYPRNPLRMCSFKTQDLKPFRIRIYKKRPGEGGLLLSTNPIRDLYPIPVGTA